MDSNREKQGQTVYGTAIDRDAYRKKDKHRHRDTDEQLNGHTEQRQINGRTDKELEKKGQEKG